MRYHDTILLSCGVAIWALISLPASMAGGSQTLRPGAGAIQAAINSAAAGDTIIVEAGTYEENLLLNKCIKILGRNRPVIHGAATGSVITITADSCRVKGLVIEHSGRDLMNEDAGILIKAGKNIIEDNTLNDVLFGIYILKADSNLVSNNQITGKGYLGLGERGSGMHIWDGRHNRFLGNTITDVRDGFYIQNANHTWVENNRVWNVRYGLHYMYADSNVFLGNTFSDNVAGAAIMYSRGIVMRHNLIARNRGFASYGILFQDCHGLTADSNVIVDNVVGMFFEASTGNRFTSNVVAQNDMALQMFQNSTGNTFTRNSFIDNLGPLAIVGKRTESRWSEHQVGNYWSSYDGYDLDGDGIGDIPMKIQNAFQYLEGRNANVRLYLYSPASQALAVAAKAFPVMEINGESDPHPLMHPPDMRALPAVQRAFGEWRPDEDHHEGHTRWWSLVPVLGCILIGVVYHRYGKRL